MAPAEHSGDEMAPLDKSTAAAGQVRFLIAGMSRSGTTVAQRIMSEIDGVWVPPETHFWRHAAAMARRFPFPLDNAAAVDALHWLAGLDSSQHLSFDPVTVGQGLPQRSFLWDMFVALVRALSPPAIDVLGEKTPGHLRWAEQLLAAVPDLCLIGLIRDPREVYRSHSSLPWGVADLPTFAEKWIELSQRLRDCRRLFGDRVLSIRYEDLVSDPAMFRKRALALLRLGEPRETRPIDQPGSLFAAEEWWKKGALEPVEVPEERWRSELSSGSVSLLEKMCRDEMVLWGYEKVEPERHGASLQWSDRSRKLREGRARADAVPLPINEHRLAAWSGSDAQAAGVAVGGPRLRQAHHQEDVRQLKSAIASANHALTATRDDRNSWRERAESLQGEERRLRKLLVDEQVQRLQAERARVIADGHFRRLQARRWWRLHSALGAWRRRPWRIDRFIATCWRLLVRDPTLPPVPDVRAIDTRLAELGAAPGKVGGGTANTPEASGGNDLEKALRLYRERKYEAALSRLEDLPRSDRLSRRACLIARDCHIKMGDLRGALSDVRQALESGPDEALERQARSLVGRLRETNTAWLPDVGLTLRSLEPPDSRRVLHIVKESLPFFERGYTIRSHATFLAQKLAGFQPVVVTSLGFPRHQGFDDFPTSETIDGIEHHRLDLGPDYRLDEVPADMQLSDQATLTGKLAERLRPAVIQAGSGYRGYETALVGLAVARQLNIPFVYEVRSFLEQTWTAEIGRSEEGEYYWRRRRQELRCMQEADHVITIAEGMRKEIVNRGVPAEKVSVVPNVVDVERFTPRDPDPELQGRHGIKGRPVLGYVSNLGQREGIEHLIRAVAILQKEGVDVACLIVGEGPMAGPLESLIAELDLGRHVVLTGHVENNRIEDYYALIDIFVVPRIDDLASRLVVPLKPLEAMSMERPILAADLPALRELVSPGDRGEVFPPGNEKGLAAVAKELLDDKARCARLARAGRSWVRTERTVAANARRYTEALRKACGGRR